MTHEYEIDLKKCDHHQGSPSVCHSNINENLSVAVTGCYQCAQEAIRRIKSIGSIPKDLIGSAKRCQF